MSGNQLPLPGFEEFTYDISPASMFLLYAAHCALRDEISKMFGNELLVLRSMSEQGESKVPFPVFDGQQSIVRGLQGLCRDIDNMNDRIEGMFHAK